MKRYLIHSGFIGGHQLEYLHHLYMGALQNRDNDYIFAVPPKFDKDSKSLYWPTAENIRIITYYEQEKKRSRKGLSSAFRNAKLLGKLVKQYKADEVVVISLMEYMPFLPLFVKGHVRVSGILYRIYLYDWKNETLSKRIVDSIIYTIFSQCKVFEKIYTLNDSSAALYLNRFFNSNKFRYLPDPVPVLPNYKGKSIREELGIPEQNVVLLHPGGMLPYKGTLNILKALIGLDKKYCDKITVIFAGRASSIQPDFGVYLSIIREKLQAFYYEGYIPFEKMADFFATSDFVLIPYTTNNKSSGIVGNAAYYQKPVVVAKGGVIGKMVKRWNLGILLENHSVDSILSFLKKLPEPYICRNEYDKNHTIEQFSKLLIS